MSQGDYRVFAGAFPQGAVAERIQALRSREDPVTARITAPHVTLAGTYWRRGPATPANEAATLARLGQLAGRIARFDLVFGGVGVFPGQNVLYLRVEVTPELLAARGALVEALGPDRHAGTFTPHLTLVMRLPPARTQALLARLENSEWHTQHHTARIEALWLMQRGARDPAWRPIYSLSLVP